MVRVRGGASGGAGADVKVAVDSSASGDYLGAASNDGALRSSAPLSYTDGGDYVTIGITLADTSTDGYLSSTDWDTFNDKPEDFVSLTDTPANFTGDSLKGVRVNVGETALEFYSIVDTDEKVKVSSNDTTADYLINQLTAGTNISVTETGDGGDESVTIAGGVTTQDEGSAVETPATILNFIGADVFVVSSGGKTNVYVPAPSWVSHFDTSDGTNDCELSDHSVSNRLIADPTSEGTPFKIGSWTAGTSHSAHRTNAHTYTTTNTCSFFNNTSTTIEVNVYDVDGTTPLATHTTAAITGNTNVTVDNITIAVTSFASDTVGKYKGIITVTFNIDDVIANGGRYSVETIHHNSDDGDFTYSQDDIFSDIEPNVAALTGVTISENSSSTVQKSGVYYYDTGSTFNIGISDIDYLNGNTYPTTQVQIVGTEYGLPTLSLQGSDLTGWTTKWDSDNDSYSKANWTINSSNFYSLTTTGNVTATPIDWAAGSSQVSSNASFAVDTYNGSNSDTTESFQDESKRLKVDLSTSWDKTQDLTSYDDNNGAQIAGTNLMYPETDYSAYEPDSGSQPDYSAVSNDRTWYSYYRDNNVAHSNGIFTLTGTGLTEANMTADKFIVEISLDSGSTWYNMNEDYTGGSLSDGDGCRTDKATYTLDAGTKRWKFTLGTGGTTGSGTGYNNWGIDIKITLADNTSKFNLMNIDW